MITIDAFLVFLAAASLPVIYLWIASRWVESEDRKVHPGTGKSKAARQPAELLERAA
jgi:hypothetical protein